ncbi:transporter substrate-binding domain-containing protein [Geomonas sp. RF6]|uniref:transporter substrate-binding domain-containing protein n=1 Tax=Geomonas sp. RF6 TaxID=2897342 RepID=UPI001E54219C|nr:transporter substrate-binding domain-containing protein [Geomonas sp. RF6]UFS69884.1 transporter substrate-binding domain-containing protein [Geomonas sp. RF6]
MRKRTVILFTALAALLLSLPGTAGATAPRFGPKLIVRDEALKVASYQYPPVIDSQTPGLGMAAAIVQAAMQEGSLPVEVEVLPVRSLARRSLLFDGAPAFLGSPSLFSKGELAKLTVLPCCSLRQFYYFSEGAHRELLTWKGDVRALKGYRIGVVKGEETPAALAGMKVVSDEPKALLRKVKENEIDLVLLPEIVSQQLLRKYAADESLKLRPLQARAESLSFSLIVNRSDARGGKIREAYLRGVARLRKSGRLAEIVALYQSDGAPSSETYRSTLGAQGVIEFGSSETPPFYASSLPGDGMAGEIVHAVFTEMHLKSVIRYFPLKRLYTDHQNNHLGDPENFQGQQFSAIVPVALYRTAFFYYAPRHRKGIRFHSPEDLKGYRIGVLRGTLENREYFEKNSISVTEVDTEESLFRMLKDGRLDLCGVIRETGEYTARRLFPREAQLFTALELPHATGPITIMISAHYPDGKRIGEKVNEAFSRIIRNGSYLRILEKYYGAGKVPAEWFQELERYRVKYQQGSAKVSP